MKKCMYQTYVLTILSLLTLLVSAPVSANFVLGGEFAETEKAEAGVTRAESVAASGIVTGEVKLDKAADKPKIVAGPMIVPDSMGRPDMNKDGAENADDAAVERSVVSRMVRKMARKLRLGKGQAPAADDTAGAVSEAPPTFDAVSRLLEVHRNEAAQPMTAQPGRDRPAAAAVLATPAVQDMESDKVWELSDDYTLRENLRTWCQRQEWTLVWEAPTDMRVLRTHFFGSFEEAVEKLFYALRDNGGTLGAEFYKRNEVLRIRHVR